MRIIAKRNPAAEAREARAGLAASDWRVIREMERVLAAAGELPADLRAEREALREIASTDRRGR